VPSLVIVKDNTVQNMIKGCQTSNYYDQIINEKTISFSQNNTDKPQKRVVVYSTPTCTYCNKIKQYFNKHGIKYTDINVAANQQAATEMAQKSGQRGVPQTDINGQIVVGFDVAKLSKLLNIPTE
jgi:glutaredoxin-like YruB-family protein